MAVLSGVRACTLNTGLDLGVSVGYAKLVLTAIALILASYPIYLIFFSAADGGSFEATLPTPEPWATCVTKINHVRVVHFIPGILRDKKGLDQIGKIQRPESTSRSKLQPFSQTVSTSIKHGAVDSEFLKQARGLLDEFWNGDMTIISTSDYAKIFPIREDEFSLVLAQDVNGRWRASAILYSEQDQFKELQRVHRINNEHVVSRGGPPLKSLGYEFKLGVNLQEPGQTHFYGKEPAVFKRSLIDLVTGRCDRIMSKFGIYGSGYETVSFEQLSSDDFEKIKQGADFAGSIKNEESPHEQ